MTTQIYRHTDANAPILTNAAGSLIALLTACLITGYGTKAAAGWIAAYVGTNIAGFKTGAGSNGFGFKLTDTAITSARVKGFESIDINGLTTGDFPTELQFPNGLYFAKNDNTTAKPWTIIANEKFIVSVIDNVTTPILNIFGDFNTKKTGDVFNTAALFNSSVTGTDINALLTSGLTTLTGHYVARQHTNVGGSINIGKIAGNLSQSTFAVGGLPYPSPIDGSLHISKVQLTELNVGIRGELPLIYAINHNKPFQNQDVINGTGEFIGKTFLALNVGTTGQILVDIA